ncbi:MAG: glycosyltransferase family 2 protein [Candidatus Hodarchaeales archaeon]|jgi:cellulose synthase/poly-beta-1,6-N-acetylglucosamine synthase-like glycosyltransferase
MSKLFKSKTGPSSKYLVIIPARNEETALEPLLKKIIPSISDWVVVVDNGSTDRTRELALSAGAEVIWESRIGYGSACLAGIRYAEALPNPPEFVCFFDGDGQSKTEDILPVTESVLSKKVKFCQGSRMAYPCARLTLTPAARAANRFFTKMMALLWKQNVTDLGPLRCIAWDALQSLSMKSTGYGWTIEMTAKILKSAIPVYEIPVKYNKRTTGKSKISGNLRTSLKAAITMGLTLLLVMVFWRPSIAAK